MRGRITKTAVDRMLPDSIFWDTGIAGFAVRRQRSAPVYLVKTRIGRRQRWLTIGRHGSPWTPETARKEARRLLGDISGGSDPATRRDAKRREPTVAQVLDRYLKEHVAAHNALSTAKEAERQVEKNLKPELGHFLIGDLTRADVKRAHSSWADHPYDANRRLAYLRKALALACGDWELRADNPAEHIQAFPEPKRERHFSDEELTRIGAALAALERDDAILPGAARLLRILALTGMRLGEVLGLRWAWLDIQAGCIRLPTAKAGARAVPLGAVAIEYVRGLERIGPFICYGIEPGKAVGLKTLRRAWAELVRCSGVAGARPHDFRHTVGTFAAATGANAFLIRDLMGHRTLAMTGRYVEKSVDPLRATADQVSLRVQAAMKLHATPDKSEPEKSILQPEAQ